MWMTDAEYDENIDSRARNRLSLQERIQAIKAYETCLNYTKVGLMFKCSAKQIRTIVRKKDKIHAMYAVNPNWDNDKEKPVEKRRAKKVALLGRVMYEWFLRARRNPAICIISYKLIQKVALEVKQVLNVVNFYPNNAWLLNFRKKFNITDPQMMLQLKDAGPVDLDIEGIVMDVIDREKKLKTSPSSSSCETLDCFEESSSSSMNPMSVCATTTTLDSQARGSPLSVNMDEETSSEYPKLEPIDIIEVKSEVLNDDDSTDNTNNNQFEIQTIDQALEHLKPLEDFALMKEDYRVIGLISQLEMILKKSRTRSENHH